MVLSHKEYKSKKDLINDIKNEVLTDYKESDYAESDKLQVSIHRVVDNFSSYISIAELEKYIKWWNSKDFETIDKGLLPNNFNPCFEKQHLRILLYCVIEQDLYNIDEINKLQ